VIVDLVTTLLAVAAVGAAVFLRQLLGAQVHVISLGGVLDSDPGLRVIRSPGPPGRQARRHGTHWPHRLPRPLAGCPSVGLERGPSERHRAHPAASGHDPQHARRVHGPGRPHQWWRAQPGRDRAGDHLGPLTSTDRTAVFNRGVVFRPVWAHHTRTVGAAVLGCRSRDSNPDGSTPTTP